MVTREKETESVTGRERKEAVPTTLSSMMPWALVRAAAVAVDMVALEPKMRRKNEMVGERRRDVENSVCSVFELEGDGNDKTG